MSRKGKPSLVVRLVRLSMTLKRIWGQIKPDIAFLSQIRSGQRARMCLQQTRKALGKQGELGHSGCETEWLDVHFFSFHLKIKRRPDSWIWNWPMKFTEEKEVFKDHD